MKRFLALLLLVSASLSVCACEQPRKASEMPITITPDPTQNPQTYTGPADGDDATGASVDGTFQDLANKGAYLESGGVANNAALATVTGIPQHARVWSNGVHVGYQRESATAVGPDGNWTVTSADGGRFIHPNYADVTGQRIPSIGPVPSETTLHATPAGRINKQFVPYGTYAAFANTFSNAGTSTAYTTSSGTSVTLTSPIDTNGFGAGSNLLQAFDICKFTVSAWVYGGSGVAFNVQVWLEYSEDGGSTWNFATAGAGTLSIALTADNLPKALPLSFYHVFADGSATHRFMIRLRAISDGTHGLNVVVDSDYFEIIRP